MTSFMHRYPDGTVMWFKDEEHTVLHRVDGPAIQNTGGNAWFVEGLRHRVDGPAFIGKKGDKEWFQHGERHNLIGPAATYGDHKEWWLFDELCTQNHIEEFLSILLQHFKKKDINLLPFEVLREMHNTHYSIRKE